MTLDGRSELAMFPLGMVLFPSVVLPLHVFEPRYREMVSHLLWEASEPEFGVVLIERGSEVGGGDVRGDVGTLARIVQAAELPDGRFALTTFGVSRIRVTEWLPDDPWPRARVEDLPDHDGPHVEDTRWPALQGQVRRVLAMATELGESALAATTELSPDPALGTFQAAAALPIGAFDQQQVLEAGSAAERLHRLDALVVEQAELLEARLRMG